MDAAVAGEGSNLVSKDHDDKSWGDEVLKALENATPEDWQRSWERARRIEVARQDWIMDQLSGHPGHADLKGHHCFHGEKVSHENFETSKIGAADDWEFELMKCRACGRKFLSAFLESDGMPRSGRWFIGRMPPDTLVTDIKPDAGLRLLAQHDRLFYGGSYWGHAGKWADVSNMFRDLFSYRVYDERAKAEKCE